MAAATADETDTLADLVQRLGSIPLSRIRLRPAPGTATEKDVLAAERKGHLCELVDGVLVEKPMGFSESVLTSDLVRIIGNHIEAQDAGVVSGPDGTLKLFAGLVRIPDVAFVSWDRLRGRKVPNEPIPHLVPDLAVEVLSRNNTSAEMDRKRAEYFDAGVRLVWIVDPRSRTVDVYTGAEEMVTLRESDTLDGGDVLPGFTLPLSALFVRSVKRGRKRRRDA